jgi:hypothetical protein
VLFLALTAAFHLSAAAAWFSHRSHSKGYPTPLPVIGQREAGFSAASDVIPIRLEGLRLIGDDANGLRELNLITHQAIDQALDDRQPLIVNEGHSHQPSAFTAAPDVGGRGGARRNKRSVPQD